MSGSPETGAADFTWLNRMTRASVAALKITNVESIILYAGDTSEWLSGKQHIGGYAGYQVLVRIETDEKIDGWGECAIGGEFGEGAVATKVLIDRGIRPRLIGQNPVEYRKIWNRLYLAMEPYGRRGLAIIALSGIDTALMDVTAKAAHLPMHQLLGGKYRSEVPLYASLLFDMDDMDGTAKRGLPYVNEGYVGAKFGWGTMAEKSFGLDGDRDEKMVATIRQVLGPKAKLMVDVGRYVDLSPAQAIKMAKRLEKHDVFWLEEPLPQDDIDGFVQLTSSVDMTIAAGEGYRTIFDFKELLSRKAVDLIQPDISMVGGISEAKRIVDLARVLNTMWVPHNWSTVINTAASLHLVAASPDGFLLEHKQEGNPLVHELSKRRLVVTKGKMQVPNEPGLGIEIDESVLSKYRQT